MTAVVVGYGRAGTRHARLLRDGAVAARVLVVEPDDARRSAASDAGYEVHAALSGSVVEAADFAVVATPSPTHTSVASELVARELPCLIEKPLAGPNDDIGPLKAAASRGVTISVVSQHRFAPDFAALSTALAECDAGTLRIRRRRAAPYLARAAVDATGSSGVVFTIAIHWLDLLVAALSAPTSVERIGVHPHSANRCIADMRWGDSVIRCDAEWGESVDEEPDRLRLQTRSGEVVYKQDCIHGEGRACRISNDDLIALQLRQFAACVRGDSEPTVRLAEAAEAIRVAKAMC